MDLRPIVALPATLAQVFAERRAAPALIPRSSDGYTFTVPEGQRNDALFKLGCRLRKDGLDVDSVRGVLAVENAKSCKPPLPIDEVELIARSVMQRVTPERNLLAAATWESEQAPLVDPDAPIDPLELVPRTPLALPVRELFTQPPRQIIAYASAFLALNDLVGDGWTTHTLTVILGPPGAGKTAFMIGVALHASTTVPVLYVSTELESNEITARLAAITTGKTWRAIEKREGIDVAEVASRLPANVYALGSEKLANPETVLDTIDSEVQRIRDLHGISPLVIVDYMQDLARGGDENQRKSRVADIATRLRVIAQQRECVMLAVSSVSRAWYGPAKAESLRNSDDASVYLAAAKESGDVDYAAATVVFLDVETDSGRADRNARLCIAKARRGRTGFVGARFDGAHGRWTPDVLAAEAMTPARQQATREERARLDRQQRILAYLAEQTGGVSVTQVTDAVTGNRQELSQTLQAMSDEGIRVRRVGNDRNARYFLAGRETVG